MVNMRTENCFNPICARCEHRLRRNGYTNGKLRFRCAYCGFNETVNSIAHNRNKRTYPITNLRAIRLTVAKTLPKNAVTTVLA